MLKQRIIYMDGDRKETGMRTFEQEEAEKAEVRLL
jgi:hypothetical protein